MDNIKIKIVENPLYGIEGSTVKYPYKGQVIHTGSYDEAAIQAAVEADNPQMTEPLAGLTSSTLLTYGVQNITDEVKRFNFGSDYFAFEPAIEGSVPSVDSALGDDNTPYVNVVGGNALNQRLAKITPVIVNDDLGDVVCKSVEATYEGVFHKNEIYGESEATLIGRELSFNSSLGEKIELVNATTDAVVATASVVSTSATAQRVTFKFTTDIASGDYKLRCSSRGRNTPTANMKSKEIAVKYTYVADPLAPKVTSATCEGAAAGKCALTGKVSINGTALGTMSTSGYSLTFGVKRGDDWVVSLSPTDHYSEWTDNLIEFEGGVGDLLPEGALLEDGDIAVFRVTREGHGYADAMLTYAA